MKSDIGFLQELMPNGMVSNSSNRLVFIIGWGVVFLLIWFWELTGKVVDYALLGVIITAITGTKLYSKHIEDKAIINETQGGPYDPVKPNSLIRPNEPGLP